MLLALAGSILLAATATPSVFAQVAAAEQAFAAASLETGYPAKSNRSRLSPQRSPKPGPRRLNRTSGSSWRWSRSSPQRRSSRPSKRRAPAVAASVIPAESLCSLQGQGRMHHMSGEMTPTETPKPEETTA